LILRFFIYGDLAPIGVAALCSKKGALVEMPKRPTEAIGMPYPMPFFANKL
jgi:hypothetical protein